MSGSAPKAAGPDTPTAEPELYNTPEIAKKNIIRGHIDECIRRLNESRNTLASISRLPVELLTGIFILARDLDEGKDRCLPPASHVCRAWRAASLNCAPLWTYIECDRCPWSDEMSYRSGQCLVQLSIGEARRDASKRMSEDDFWNAVDIASELLPRATELRLIKDDIPEELGWPEAAPFLTSLHIHDGFSEYPVPPDVATALFPQLTRLVLENCTFDWKHVRMSNRLVHLDVMMERGTDHPASMVDILTALRAMPHLVYLRFGHLDGINYAQSLPLGSDGDRFHMPNLEHLDLLLDPNVLDILLYYLPRPSKHLIVDCLAHGLTLTHSILSHLVMFGTSISRAGISLTAAAVMYWDDECFEATFFDPKLADAPAPLCVKLYIPSIRVDAELHESIFDLCTLMLPFTSVEQLLVTNMEGYHILKDRLRQCTTLCFINLTVRTEEDFFRKDGPETLELRQDLPNLRTIILHGLSLIKIPTCTHARQHVPPLTFNEGTFIDAIEHLAKSIGQLKVFGVELKQPWRLDRSRRSSGKLLVIRKWDAPLDVSLPKLSAMLLES